LAGPLVVIHDFVVIPDVIVIVVGIVDPVVMMGASRAQCSTRQGGGENK